MASYSRLELLKKFKKEMSLWRSRGETHHGMDTTHIQMASVDEMMSAFGYVPRRLPNYHLVKDGRFGYVLAFPRSQGDRRYVFMSLENAVRMHNGCLEFFSRNRAASLYGSISFARENRVVETVSLQRTKKGGLIAQTRWVKFIDGE